MWTLTQFGEVTLPQRQVRVDVGAPEVTRATMTLSGGRMFDGMGSGRARVKLPYDLPYRAMVLEEDAAHLTLAHERLVGMAGRLEKLTRYTGMAEEQWCWARLVAAPAPREVANLQHLVLELVFMVESEWYSPVSSSAWRWDDGHDWDTNGLRWNCAPPVEMILPQKTIILRNTGNAPARNIRLWIVLDGVSQGSGEPSVTDFYFSVPGAIDWKWSGELTEADDGLYIDVAADAILQNTLADPIAPAYDVTFYVGHTIAELVRVEDYSTLTLLLAWNLGVNYPRLLVTTEVLDTWI